MHLRFGPNKYLMYVFKLMRGQPNTICMISWVRRVLGVSGLYSIYFGRVRTWLKFFVCSRRMLCARSNFRLHFWSACKKRDSALKHNYHARQAIFAIIIIMTWLIFARRQTLPLAPNVIYKHARLRVVCGLRHIIILLFGFIRRRMYHNALVALEWY